MRELSKSLSTKPLAPESKMTADFKLLNTCMNVPEFCKILEDDSGIVQNLTLPAQKFFELCVKVIKQHLFGKFAEAEMNNPTYQKMYNSEGIAELTKPVTDLWDDHHNQYKPKKAKVEWEDTVEEIEAPEEAEGTSGFLWKSGG